MAEQGRRDSSDSDRPEPVPPDPSARRPPSVNRRRAEDDDELRREFDR
jgi:hypothetical protein